MKKVLFFAFILLSCVNLRAQNGAAKANFDLTNYGVRVEPDRRLITVLASLEAADLDAPLTAKGAKFRGKVRADAQNLNPELRQKIKIFVEQYKRRHPNLSAAALVSPFVSMAYSLSPAPDLLDPTRTTDLPGDLLEVLDYAPLAREFYRRMTAAKIDEYAKIYQAEADADLRRSAAQMVSELLDYLHTKPQLTYIERVKTQSPSAKNKKQTLQKTEIRERERRFFIVPEMLAPRGTINFLNIGDDYFAVVPLETDLSQSEVRRAYLQFALDPLILNNAKDISVSSEPIRKMLADLKQTLVERQKTSNVRAEDVSVSPDVFLAVSRSLVAAADARQTEFAKTQIATAQARRTIDATKTDDDKRKVSARLDAYKKSLADETALQLSEAYEKGAVLSFYFADQLKGLESSGFDVAGSFREMILSLDATKEANRYAQFADARARALATRVSTRKASGDGETITIENPTTKRLLDIEKIIQTKNYAQAETELKQLLDANPIDAPRIYYAIGRNASLSAEKIADVDARNRRLLEAKVAYENVVRSASTDTDRELVSLSYVALGRLYEYEGDNDYAVKIYEAAIKSGDAGGEAHKQATAARARLLKKP